MASDYWFFTANENAQFGAELPEVPYAKSIYEAVPLVPQPSGLDSAYDAWATSYASENTALDGKSLDFLGTF